MSPVPAAAQVLAFDLPVALFGIGLVVLLVSLLAMHPSSLPTFQRLWREADRIARTHGGRDESFRSVARAPSVAAGRPGAVGTPAPPRRVVTGPAARLDDRRPRRDTAAVAPGDTASHGDRVQDAGLARHVPIAADGSPRRTKVEDAEAVIEHYLDTGPEHLARALTAMIAADRDHRKNQLD
jgi:hypothetical protein